MIENPRDLEEIGARQKEIPFPRRFAVELCADCNLSCTMCHHDQMVRPKGVMPLALWKKCADEIAATAPASCECWLSFCGEPLIEPELLLACVAYGKQVGIETINLNTNGMLLREELAGPLLDVGLSKIVVGVDGFSAETYESIRVGGVRDVIYERIEHLLKLASERVSPPEVLVQFILMEENHHEAEAFCAHWIERGASVKVRNQLSWGGKFGTPLDVPDEERIACPWAMTMMHVFWDGRVPRCPGDTEGEEGSGSAWHDSLADLWAGVADYRGHHLARDFDRLPERCQSCKDWMVGVAERIRPVEKGSRMPWI